MAPEISVRIRNGRAEDAGPRLSSRPASVDSVRGIMQMLMPCAVVDTPAAPDADEQVLHAYLPFPSLRMARFLVPLESRQAAAAAVSLRSPARAGGPRQIAYSLAARGLARGVLQRLLTSRVELVHSRGALAPLPSISLVEHVSEILGQPVLLSAKVGRADPHRTVGMHVIDGAGKLLGFLKVTGTALPAQLLGTEATALGRLPRETARVMTAPELVHHGEWNGLTLLLTTPLDLHGSRQPSPARSPGVEAMLEVADSGPRITVPLVESVYWERTARRLEEMLASEALPASRKQFLSDLFTTLESTLGTTVLDFGGWHGDWLPWNLAWKSGRLLTWDWEYWTDCVPVGFDMLHFFSGTYFFRDSHDTRGALTAARDEGGRLLVGSCLSASKFQAVYALYVMEFLLRRLDIVVHGGGKDDARVFPSIFSVAYEALLTAAQAKD